MEISIARSHQTEVRSFQVNVCGTASVIAEIKTCVWQEFEARITKSLSFLILSNLWKTTLRSQKDQAVFLERHRGPR